MSTALDDQLAPALDFGDARAEFRALVSGCGVYEVKGRARIGLTGSDRVRWLNGMVTNNIRDLARGRGVYAFMLNPQGRILADFYVFHRGDRLLIDTDQSQVENILAAFDHYIIMDEVEVSNLTLESAAIGVGGPNSREVLRAAGLELAGLAPLEFADAAWQQMSLTVLRTDHEAIELFELWLAPADAPALSAALRKAGATPVGAAALESLRMASGIPRYGQDIRERDLPQETEQMRALNFNKGCYVGQEIVERIRSRGNVHRKFTNFVVEGAAAIAAGDKIVVGKPGEGEKDVGEITSVATLRAQSGEQTVALGYIRREVGVTGREVTIRNIKATVVQFPVESVALV
jgi:folate-binding protein YgfZ